MQETGSETADEVKPSKHKNAQSFTKSNPKPGPGRGHKRAKGKNSSVLSDLETAYSTDQDPKESPGVAAARKLLHDDYPKFITLYAKARGEILVEEPAVAAAAEVIGPNEERIEELAESLLSEWEAQNVRA